MTAPNLPNSTRFDAWRLFVLFAVILVILTILLGRLISLQVFGSQNWIDAAVGNYTKDISSPAPRGIIYDRNGYILARNIASYNVTIIPAYLPDDDADIQRIYRSVSDLTGIPVNEGTLDEASSLRLV